MINRSAFVKAAAATAVALAALGTASVAQAAGNVAFSIGGNIAPGVAVGVSSAPGYGYGGAVYGVAPPVAPVYVQPAPVYYPPAPVYYQPVVYAAPYYGYYGVRYVNYGHGGHGHGHGH